MKDDIRTERVVITLLIPQDGADTNMDWLLTLLFRATQTVGGLMFVAPSGLGYHKTTPYTLSIPKRIDMSASSMSDCDPG